MMQMERITSVHQRLSSICKEIHLVIFYIKLSLSLKTVTGNKNDFICYVRVIDSAGSYFDSPDILKICSISD